jgi:hypothetical protein
MKSILRFCLFFAITLLINTISLSAQKYYGASKEQFGKSRIQSKDFEWKTIKSNNFEFNFYRGGEELAKKAAKKAESEYDKITELLGYTPFSVMKVFIYNNPEDAKQSNIGLTAPLDIDGGILNLTKARIQISYQKNDTLFYNTLIKEITTLFVYDMLYGGSLKEAVQSQLLLMVPPWFVDGISAYIAEPNNSTQFDLFQKTVISTSNTKLTHLENEEARIIGQSIWHYIAIKYGKDNISNILNLTRIIRNEQSSITSTLGVSFNKFIKDWRKFYIENENAIAENPQKINTQEIEKVSDKIIVNVELKDKKQGEIDVNNYFFEEKNVVLYKVMKANNANGEIVTSEKQNADFKKNTEELKLGGIKAYHNLLVSNELDVEFQVDPTRRFGLAGNIVLNDMLENHVITIGAFLRPSTPFFKNYDYNVSYANYAHKIDYKLSFEKRSINFESIDQYNNYLFRPLKIFPADNFTLLRRVYSQKITASVSYPLTENLKFEFNPSYLKTTDIDYEVPGRDNLNNFYLTTQFNAIFDNTIAVAKNINLGTKGKISFEKNISFNNNLQNFSRLNLDLRHYHKIIKGLVIAGRFNYGRSMGNSPKFTYVGGIENSINKTVHDAKGLLPGDAGDFRDILFYNFAGNLRGFDFARLFGHNHILTNIELRASLVDYFPRSSITSSFLRNLQFVTFYDFGTAWNGTKGPLSKQNSLNTILIGADGRSPYFAEVTSFKNPFLMGAGIGLRTTILGFMVKADYAVGREDKEFSKPKLVFSFGLDF